ncbi:hypothetical protein OAK12_01465 [Alphaproteobacteria bacterium]|nr:hypothetical protein [Alphaproteobacteria bacterium]
MAQTYYIENLYSKFIEIKGIDSKDFLQSLITNDINKCENNKLIYSCFLSPQGKFLADFFITRNKDCYLIEIHEKYLLNFLEKLSLYKLRSNISITENNEMLSFILFNKNITDVKIKNNIYKDPRNSNLGDKIFCKKKSHNFKILKSILKLDFENYKIILMKFLIPNTSEDLIVQKSLLLENNFQNINAISWNKGCYVGQEITARMKYRSLIKKKIYVLELLSGNINRGDAISENNINIGNIISKVEKYVLCMLKINLIDDKFQKKKEITINQSVILKFL